MLGLAKFLTGFFLAIALLFAAGVASTRYLITKLTTTPERPVFTNETAVPPPDAESVEGADPPIAANDPTETVNPSLPPEVQDDSEAQDTADNQNAADNEEGYRAIVTQPIGLILRADSTQESRRITGLAYDTEIEILGESPDQAWLRVRIPGSDIEGWVKAGNTAPVQ
jgi:hypothetical protein